MTEEGMVKKTMGDKAWVVTRRSEMCEACASQGACTALGGGKEMEVEAINAAKAKFLQSGDANGDGFVGADDLVTVLSNWGRSPAGRTEGDLNGDSLVGADDYVQVLTYWGTDYTGAEPVPEPATMFIILAGGLPAVRSRRYR